MDQNVDDRRDELAALARLVVYARGCAEIIQAKDVEERLVHALDAIKSELGDAGDVNLVDFFGPSNTSSTMQ